MAKVVFEASAGGVVVDGGRVLLIRARNLKGEPVWTLPKGLMEPGEDPQAAALREVQEETGYVCRIERELPRSQYWFRRDGTLVKKTVHWYLMHPVEKVGEHDWEVEEVAWVPLEEARKRVTYRSDRALLEQVSSSTAGTPDTSA